MLLKGMDLARFKTIVEQYPLLQIAVLGDFCLDRYLEIDPTKQEVSIETGLPVHNVIQVRAQAGGAGTIVNNLAALGIGKIYPVGFAGQDGEGFELWSALEKRPGVRLSHFVKTAHRLFRARPAAVSVILSRLGSALAPAKADSSVAFILKINGGKSRKPRRLSARINKSSPASTNCLRRPRTLRVTTPVSGISA